MLAKLLSAGLRISGFAGHWVTHLADDAHPTDSESPSEEIQWEDAISVMLNDSCGGHRDFTSLGFTNSFPTHRQIHSGMAYSD